MAKYCGNCGSEMEENAKVCGNCGTPFDDGNKTVPKEELKSFGKGNKSKMTVKYGIIAFIAIVLIVGVFNVASNFTGKKGLVGKVMNAYEKYDIDALVSMSSDLYSYADENYAEIYFKEAVGNDLDYYENNVGHNYKLSYKIDEIYSASERKKSELIDSFDYLFPDFDTDMISDIAIADVTVHVKKESKEIERKVNIFMTKEKDGWKVLYIQRN